MYKPTHPASWKSQLGRLCACQSTAHRQTRQRVKNEDLDLEDIWCPERKAKGKVAKAQEVKLNFLPVRYYKNLKKKSNAKNKNKH